MATGIYIAMGGARNQERRLDTLSNDLANAQTPGFKTQEAIYKQIHTDATALSNPNQAMGLNHPVRFLPEDRLPVVLDQRYTKFSQGSLRFTGNDLDLAINGEGFFTVEGANGPVYTRNGTFMTSKDGTIVDQQGFALLDEKGAPIVLPNAAGKVGVGSDGTVSVGEDIIAQLGLVKFNNQQELERIGNSGYQNPVGADDPIPLDDPDVRQQYLESANVNPVHTMAMLIKTNRVFDLNTRAMQAYKEMDEQSAREVGRLR